MIEEKPLTKIEQFFYDNAGYGYDPATETEEQGKQRGARELARAEQYALEENWHYEWDLDENTDRCAGEGHEHYCCQLWDGDGTRLLASLCDICKPDKNYQRVVEAELALEAMPNTP